MKILFVFLFFLFGTSIVHSESISGRVVAITDGDTIKLLTTSKTLHKIRLSGVDAPERDQPFGNKSKQALSDCSYNKNADVETYKKDRYGRLVGKVMIDGIDCNLKQVQSGMAWHYKKYQVEQELEDRSKYAQAEHLAQKNHVGLWVDTNPLAPWEWRKARRRK